MKKSIITLTLIFMSILLVGCQTDSNDNEVILEEDFTKLEELGYFSYLKDTNPIITIKVKGLGEIKAQLFPEVVKNTVNNMLIYIEQSMYNNNSFHRVIEDFMIQGGSLNDTFDPIAGEFQSNKIRNSIKHFRGVLSMARTNDFNSATSQFFIVHEDSHFLDTNYASFGGLISGFNILDFIAKSKTDANDAPLETITIESITVDLKGYVAEPVIYA